MRVFSLRSDVNRYQYFLLERDADWERLLCDCTPKAAIWVPPPVFVNGDITVPFGSFGIVPIPWRNDSPPSGPRAASARCLGRLCVCPITRKSYFT